MIQIGLAMVSFGIGIFIGMKIIGGKNNGRRNEVDNWNSLSPEGRKLWIGEGQVLPTLKNGRYAAKKKPQIIKRKFDAKWNADTNQILAIINK